MTGDLTIKDVTRPVSLDVVYSGQARDPKGNMDAGFSAYTTINRKDWGLTWNVALETGGLLVGDQIKIALESRRPFRPPPPCLPPDGQPTRKDAEEDLSRVGDHRRG